jgi:ketosteroid isomerase-like protein
MTWSDTQSAQNDDEHANPNLRALQRAYADWHETKGESVDELLDLFDNEVEMHSVLEPDFGNELAGSHVGKARAREYFGALARDWEMLFYHVERFVADGDDVVAVCRCAYRNRATGREIETPKVDVWRFGNGKVTGFTEMFDSLGFAKAVGAI